MEVFRLDGKRALITGGSKGIGFGIAKGLAEAGAEVVLAARREPELRAAQEALQRDGHRAHVYSVDMRETQQLAAFFSRVVDETGGCDILVNNAGINLRGPAHEQDLGDWSAVLNVNLTAVFALCQAFARHRMAADAGGKVINIASLTSEATRPNIAAYTTTKGGVKMLTKALAVEWAPHRICVNAIGPGYIDTDLTKPLRDDPQFDTWVKNRTPLGRWGKPDDLAHAAVFLASPASDFVTGQVLYVDGGWLAAF